VDATVFVVGIRITRSVVIIAVAGGTRERCADKFWRVWDALCAGGTRTE
jgi:hypothetical protein